MKVDRLAVGPLDVNCYIASSAGQAVVIDPGGNCEAILHRTKELQVAIECIVNTHYHFDHVLADEDLKKATGAKICIHEKEKEYLGLAADRWLKEGDKIAFGQSSLEVIDTPGHSAGSICLLGEKEIFTGDTLFRAGRGRTDLAGGSEEDIKNSLSRLSGIIKPGMTVYPGHGEIFRIN